MSDDFLIVIRRPHTSELPELLGLINAHAEYEETSVDVSGLRSKIEQAMQGEQPRLSIYVAVANDGLVGYCSMTCDFSTWRGQDYLHMDCLYVIAKRRGQSIGKLLFNKVKEFATERGIDHIEWQTPDWNTDAQCFYQSLGARSSSKRRYLYSVN